MTQPSEDVAWIRARAQKLVDEKGMDPEDALAEACQERVDFKESRDRKRAKHTDRKPLKVSLGDLLKARGNR